MKILLTIMPAVFLFLISTVPVSSQEITWESPTVSTQLEMDETLVPIGKGAIFCPAMTNSENEPVYGVLKDGKMVENARMGKRIPLAPGVYTVVYGSGTVDQMMQKTVRVEEGSTTVIKPDWSALSVDVINSGRAHIREYYELFSFESGLSYGIGQGVEEGMDEKLMTWILPPGRYKIVRPGDNINTVTNFGTIRLLPGELVNSILTMNVETGDFLGFGFLSDFRQTIKKPNKHWLRRSELSGNALLNYVPSSSTATETNSGFTSTIQWLSDARYENNRHIIPVWSNIEEGLSIDQDKVLTKYIDKAELKLTYIYRFTDILSPYVRVSGETRLFSTSQHFKDPTDYFRLNSDGDTLTVVKKARNVKLGNSFAPIYYKQGIGITSIIVKTLPININLRSGYGARRTIAGGAYIYDTASKTLSPVIKTDTTGMEFLLLGDIRLGKYVIFSTEFDVLTPKTDHNTWIYDGENRLRINLTGNVSLLVTMEWWKYADFKNTQSRYQTLLRFSKFL